MKKLSPTQSRMLAILTTVASKRKTARAGMESSELPVLRNLEAAGRIKIHKVVNHRGGKMIYPHTVKFELV